MYFELGANTLTLQEPAQYPYKKKYELMQVKERSATGHVHVETYEVEIQTHSYKFDDMTTSEYEELLNWVVSVSVGMKNSFTLVDDLGVSRNVRFTTPIIDFSLNSYDLWSGSFEVEEV